MKKTLLALSIVTLGMVACKKDDPAPVKQIVTSSVALESFDKNPDNNKSLTWYSVSDGKPYAMENIKANPSLSKNIDFGFMFEAGVAGLYSVNEYPVVFGQEAWPTKNTTTFKAPSEADEANLKLAMSENKLTPDLVSKVFDASTLIGKIVSTPFPSYIMFKTTAGSVGIIEVSGVINSGANLDIRVVK